MKNIILIGMPASGKTTIARAFVHKYKEYSYIDTDTLLSNKHNKTIPEIIEDKGIDYFRKEENKLFTALLEGKKQIISTGGGIVLEKENRLHLSKEYVVFLYVPLSILEERLLQDTENNIIRPLVLPKEDITKRVAILWKERRNLYYSSASKSIYAVGEVESIISSIYSSSYREF